MQAVIFCFLFVAYGDSTDYIPANARSVGEPASRFIDAAGKSVRNLRDTVKASQQGLDSEFRPEAFGLPRPLNNRTTNQARAPRRSVQRLAD